MLIPDADMPGEAGLSVYIGGNMNVTFYEDFEKDPASTKKPSGDGTSFECVLKENCGILNPTIILGLGYDKAPYDSMYARISDFGRYYFVNEWVWAGGVWEVTLTVDPMATYRSDIGSQSQYILRSSNRNNDNITDTNYPANGGYIVYNRNIFAGEASQYKPFNGWKSSYEDGTYVIGVVNGDTSSTIGGGVSYYCCTNTWFKTFLNAMMSSLEWAQIDTAEISEQLLKAIFNPAEYIVSCIWLPIELDTEFLGKAQGALKFGYWQLPFGGYSLSKGRYGLIAQCNAERHPQAESEFSYLNLPPFTRYTLLMPGFGEIAIDPLDLFQSPNFYITIDLDLITGMAILELSRVTMGTATGAVFARHRAQVGVPIQLAQLKNDIGGGIGGIAGAVGGLLNLDLGKVASGIGSAVNATIPRATTIGTTGSIAEYGQRMTLLCEFCEQVEIDNAHAGKPLCEMHKPSSLKGYMTVENPKIELNATRGEIDTVKDYMANGFYYE